MTKNKRFELDSEVGFIDTQKCGGDTMTPFEVVVKLNKLNDENEQLKKDSNNEFNQSNCITVQNSIINDLKKENEQLKSINQHHKDYIADLEADFKRSEEENEQLKSEINMLKITIARNEAYIEKITHKGEWHC